MSIVPLARRRASIVPLAVISVLLSAVVSMLVAPVWMDRATPIERLEPDAEESPAAAWDMPRAYPFDRIPAGAFRRARLHFETQWRFGARLSLAAIGAVFGSDLANREWTSLGPYRIGASTAGRIAGLALDAGDSSVIYAAAASGGVWKTGDGGQSWAPLTDTTCSLAMGAIATDPANPAILYAGTGEANINHSYYGCGLLRSTDAGATWTQLGAEVWETEEGGASIGRILVDPDTAGSDTGTTVFAASSVGLFKSFDSGLSWAQVLPGRVNDIVVIPGNASVLYAAVATDGIYQSQDGGDSWDKLTDGLPANNIGRIGLAIAPSDPSRLYAAFGLPWQSLTFHNSSGGAFRGLWMSTDAGASWTQAGAQGASGARSMYNLVLEVDPEDADTVYLGLVDIFKSTDAGSTFASIRHSMHVDHHAMSIDSRTSPPVLYVGNDGGVWTSANRGGSWSNLNNGIVNMQFSSPIALHPTDATNALGGLQDNGTIEYTGQPSWRSVAGSDGGFSAINFLTGLPAFRTPQFGPPSRRDSPNGSFVTRAAGLSTSGSYFYPPLVMDPTDSQVLYFGSNRVWRTADNADSWVATSPNLTSRSVTVIAAAPSDGETVYAGTSDGRLWVTHDVTAELPSWDLVTNGLPNRFITSIAVDPSSAFTAYAVCSGFGSGHVFQTTDGGVSWHDISGNLPDIPVNAIARHADMNALFIGTDLGVFVLEGGSTGWQAMTNGMPNVAITGLTINLSTKKLVAATWGRGAFSLDLP